MSILLLLALALGPPALLDDTRGSFEQFLERMRAERDARLEALGEQVEDALRDLEKLSRSANDKRAASLRWRLAQLGPEAAPLLVDALEPGAEATPGQEFRARQVSQVLADLASPAATDALLDLVRTGTAPGRANALRALETTPEAERVLPVVEQAFRSSAGDVRRAALVTLARVGGADAERWFVEALEDPDAALVEVALRSLTETRDAAASGAVLALVQSGRAAPHLDGVLDYYAAVPAAFEPAHVLALVALLDGRTLGNESKVHLLDRLRDFEIARSTDFRRAMEAVVENSTSSVGEAARIVLARMGDSGARRDLLKPYNHDVGRNKSWAKAYARRAEVLYKIGEYRDAIKDYKKDLDLRRRGDVSPDSFIGIARCFARLGKFKDAADYLDSAPITIPTLHELATEPDFAEMVAAPKYRATFHLPEPGK